MININLLPPEVKSKIKEKKHIANVLSICLVAVFIVVVLLVIAWSFKNSLLAPSLANEKEAISKANDQLKSFDKLENQALFLNDRIKLTTDIESKRVLWSQLITDLISSVPTDVQFTGLTADLNKTPNFTLNGNTTSEREIIKFKEKLENSDFFKDVAFKSSATTDTQNGTEATAGKLNFVLEFNLEKTTAKDKGTK